MRGSDASLNENERITNPKRRFNADRNARRFTQRNAGLAELKMYCFVSTPASPALSSETSPHSS